MSPRFSLDKTPRRHTSEVSVSDSEPQSSRVTMQGVPVNPAPVAPASRSLPRPEEEVYVPEYYEPNYAYPLIVWIQSPQGDEPALSRLMPQISTRNYFGLALTSNLAKGMGAEPETESVAAFEQKLLETVLRVRRDYHIHSERIFIAGFGEAGALALRLGLQRPERYAGIVGLAATLPEGPSLLARYNDLRGKRVFLGGGLQDDQVSTADVSRARRLLHTAGLRVCGRNYEAGHEITRTMLSEIDRWVMGEIYQRKTAVR